MTSALTDAEVHEKSKRLFSRADLVLAVIFLSPEAGSPPFGLTPPEYYVGSRGALLGDVPGAVVAAAFGLIQPEVTASTWASVRPRVSIDELNESKTAMALTVLERVRRNQDLPDPEPIASELDRALAQVDADGHPLFAGSRAQPEIDDPVGRLWRQCEQVREHRGGAHVCAYRAAGLSGAEINVLTELWRDQPIGSEATVVNGWSEQELDDALASLAARGWVRDRAITEAGRQAREEIEHATSRAQRGLVSALGERYEAVDAGLKPWADAVRRALRPPYWWHTWKPA